MRPFIKACNYLFSTIGGSGTDIPETLGDTVFANPAVGDNRVSKDLEGNLVSNVDGVLPATANAVTNIPTQFFVLPAHARLPIEMLAKIFFHSSEDSKIEIPADLSNISPWNCSRVCSAWRAAAHSMPELWVDITVDFKKWSNYVGHVNIVNAILSRHPQSLISLTITPGRSRYYEAYAPIEYITRHLLNTHCNQFGSLCFKRGYNFGAFLAQPPGSLGSLETLRWTIDNPVNAVSVFQDAPSLRKIFIDLRSHSQWFSEFNLLTLSLPWSQLTHIHFPGSLFTLADAFALLRQSVNLEDCRLGISTIRTENSMDTLDVTSLITLPALGSLVVEDRNLRTGAQHPPSGITNLLGSLNLPNLINFRITQELETEPLFPSIRWGDMAFIDFIQRCLSLENLVIDEVVPSRYLEHLLRSAPSLVKLSIRYGDNLPTRAIQCMSNPDFLPNLGILDCCVSDLHVFLDMLESRCSVPSSPLREVSINVDANGRGASDVSRRRVESLNEAGRKIMFQG